MAHIFLKLPEVKRRTGKCKTSIYQEIKEGTFPKQIYNGRSSVAWLESEITQWQELRIKLSANQNNKIKNEQEKSKQV